MINDDKDDDLDIYYPHSDAPKPAWPSADRGGNRFSASSLRLPWVNPLQTLQSPFFPSKSFPRLRSTPVSHPIWIMFWGVAQNKKPWLEVKSNYCFLWNTLSDNFQKEKFFWALLVVGLFLRTGRDTGHHQLNYVCFPGMRASKIIQKVNASRYLTNLSMRVILFVPF